MNLENVMPRATMEHKSPYAVSFHLYEISRSSKTIEVDSRLVVR